MRRTLAGSMVAAVAVVAMTSGTAFAGERGGSGKPTPINDYRANSICSFSGLEDFDFEEPVQPGVVQNWGSIPKDVRAFLASIGEHPSVACNGHLNGLHP
jgi:hypothetical protein